MHRAGLVVWDVLNDFAAGGPAGRDHAGPGEDCRGAARAEAWRSPGIQELPRLSGVLCTSINQEVVHGIPSASRRLKEGDIISLDFGVELDGYYGDAAVTVPVGEDQARSRRSLLQVTRESLDLAHRQGSRGQPA